MSEDGGFSLLSSSKRSRKRSVVELVAEQVDFKSESTKKAKSLDTDQVFESKEDKRECIDGGKRVTPIDSLHDSKKEASSSEDDCGDSALRRLNIISNSQNLDNMTEPEVLVALSKACSLSVHAYDLGQKRESDRLEAVQAILNRTTFPLLYTLSNCDFLKWPLMAAVRIMNLPLLRVLVNDRRVCTPALLQLGIVVAAKHNHLSTVIALWSRFAAAPPVWFSLEIGCISPVPEASWSDPYYEVLESFPENMMMTDAFCDVVKSGNRQLASFLVKKKLIKLLHVPFYKCLCISVANSDALLTRMLLDWMPLEPLAPLCDEELQYLHPHLGVLFRTWTTSNEVKCTSPLIYQAFCQDVDKLLHPHFPKIAWVDFDFPQFFSVINLSTLAKFQFEYYRLLSKECEWSPSSKRLRQNVTLACLLADSRIAFVCDLSFLSPVVDELLFAVLKFRLLSGQRGVALNRSSCTLSFPTSEEIDRRAKILTRFEHRLFMPTKIAQACDLPKPLINLVCDYF